MPYKLLTQFETLFCGTMYRHRNSSQGDKVARYLYEDLFDLNRSPKLATAIARRQSVLNTSNRAVGRTARRGDGTFGERVPTATPTEVPGLAVAIGAVATIEIGVEVKILAKAMIKQIDRVCTDLQNQASQFRSHGGTPICVAIAAINHAASYTGFEGDRAYPTDGRKYAHPIQEAGEAERRITDHVRTHFDELIFLRFNVTNAAPFAFEWVDIARTESEYAASLIRISRAYESRF